MDFTISEALRGRSWVRAVDTGLPSPEDILLPGTEKPLPSPGKYTLKPRSMVILLSKNL
jgi:hypothetical protein